MKRRTQIWLTIFFIVLELSKPTEQFKGWSIFAAKCDDMLGKIEDCWIENTDLPTCNGDDPAIECAEKAKENVKNCKKDIIDGVTERYNAIKALKDVLCENTELKDEFEKKISCWHTARSCSSSLASSLGDDDDSKEDSSASSEEENECSELLDEVENCNQISTGCTELQNNLTYYIFEKSPCVAHAEKFLSNACPSMCNLFTTVFATLCLIYISC